jgi:hypothetical protein
MGKVIQFPSKKLRAPISPELDASLERIKGSLAKINQLMQELKDMSKRDEQNVDIIKR